MSYLAEDGISHASVKCYLSALRRMQIAQCFPDSLISNMPKLEAVVKGIKAQQAKNQTRVGFGYPSRLTFCVAFGQFGNRRVVIMTQLCYGQLVVSVSLASCVLARSRSPHCQGMIRGCI